VSQNVAVYTRPQESLQPRHLPLGLGEFTATGFRQRCFRIDRGDKQRVIPLGIEELASKIKYKGGAKAKRSPVFRRFLPLGVQAWQPFLGRFIEQKSIGIF
jgi:hypothetical protein